MNESVVNIPIKCKEGDYWGAYNIFVWILSILIILANVLLIFIILKSTGLRRQVIK